MTERISSTITGAGVSIHFDGEKDCVECGKPGASPSGLCLACLGKAMKPGAKMRSREGRTVQRRATQEIGELRTKARQSLHDAVADSVRNLHAAADPVPEAEPIASLTVELNAFRCAVAWLNAYLAHSEDEARPQLYRTLAVEVFPTGVQFVGCDGHLLFRTWAPLSRDANAPMPLLEEAPDRTVVVMDVEKFAQGFVRTLKSTAAQEGNTWAPVALTVEAAPTVEQPLLGEAFAAEVLVLRAFGQRLTCRLYDGEYVNWRRSSFGLKAGEQVDGMRLAVRAFATVGKLSGILGVECTFNGDDRAIEIHGKGDDAEVRGLLMPMRRDTKADAADTDTEQAS